MAKASLRRRVLWYSVLGITMIGSIFVIATERADSGPDPVAAQKTREINTAIALARDVRRQVKNPKSFDLAAAIIQGDGTVCMTYRATNSFNAVVPAQAIRQAATYWVSESDVGFAQRWRSLCAGRGRDETRMVQRFLDG